MSTTIHILVILGVGTIFYIMKKRYDKYQQQLVNMSKDSEDYKSKHQKKIISLVMMWLCVLVLLFIVWNKIMLLIG